MSTLTREAATAAELLSSMGDRWTHTQAVAARAEAIKVTVAFDDRDLLVSAAWLHDVGYALPLRSTGFHPLDGARFLELRGFERRLCALVAQHSGARFEAEERGLARELAVYELEDSPVMDALVVADLTTGPRGQLLDYEDRMAEILTRYPPTSPVYRAITRARAELAVHVDRVQGRLAAL